jgi:hypothetical protein
MEKLKQLIVEAVKFYRDNPGGDWLKYKQENAMENFSRFKGIRGSVTGTIRTKLPVSMLKDFPGARNEEEYRHPGRDKYDRLANDVKERGWDHEENKNNPVLIGVNHFGHAYTMEGNHRIAYASRNGIKHIHAEVRYWNGGEDKEGPMHPDIVKKNAIED